jgi:hypothetical protein
VVILFGSYGLNIDSQGNVTHTFRPFVAAITMSEIEGAFDKVFEGFLHLCKYHCNITTIKINGIVIDHSYASYNSITNNFSKYLQEFNELTDEQFKPPEVYSCITHVERNLKDNKHRVDGKYYDTHVSPMFNVIKYAKNKLMFDILCKTAIGIWSKDGYAQYCQYIEKVYFNSKWEKFFLNCIYPGVHPDNNLLESVNGQIKKILQKGSSLGEFLNNGIDKIFQ